MFTNIEQADHCKQLIEFLEKLPNKQYDHMLQNKADINDPNARSCALGWAASIGIGGLNFHYMRPAHPDVDSEYTSLFAAYHVFGESSYDEVFRLFRDKKPNEMKMTEKQLSVSRLKTYEAALRKGKKVK